MKITRFCSRLSLGLAATAFLLVGCNGADSTGPLNGQLLLVSFDGTPTNADYAAVQGAGGTVRYSIKLADALAVASEAQADEFRKLPHVVSVQVLGSSADPRVSAAIVLDRPATELDLDIVRGMGAVSAEGFEGDELDFINIIRIPLSALVRLERYPQFKRVHIYANGGRTDV